MAAIKALKDDEIQKQVAQGYFTILDQRIELDEVRIIYCTSEQVGGHFEAHSDNEVLVLLDMTPNEELLEEGLAREVINRVQKLKKKAQLIPTDPVLIFHELETNITKKETLETQAQLKKVLSSYSDMIKTAIKSDFAPYSADKSAKKRVIASELVDLKGIPLKLTICSTEDLQLPNLPFLNVALAEDLKPRFGNGDKASLFLQHNATKQIISLPQLRSEIEVLFGLYGVNFNIYVVDQKSNAKELTSVDKSLNGKLLVLSRGAEPLNSKASYDVPLSPYSKFVNHGPGSAVFIENPKGITLN